MVCTCLSHRYVGQGSEASPDPRTDPDGSAAAMKPQCNWLGLLLTCWGARCALRKDIADR